MHKNSMWKELNCISSHWHYLMHNSSLIKQYWDYTIIAYKKHQCGYNFDVIKLVTKTPTENCFITPKGILFTDSMMLLIIELSHIFKRY